RAVDVRALAGADARIAVAARPAAAADGDLLVAFFDVGDLRAEVGPRPALRHIAFAVAVGAFAGEQVGHRLGLLFLQRDVVLLFAALVVVASGLLGRLGLLGLGLGRRRAGVRALVGLRLLDIDLIRIWLEHERVGALGHAFVGLGIHREC